VGIAPELQARVFEPFFTTKGEEGTGLGLAISHSIIDEHDGEINLESRIGHGTIFKLCLPTHAG
jgi:signal transduction histidine kinase